MHYRLPTLLIVIATIALATISSHAAEEVNLYSARKEALIKPLLHRFTEETGIKVNLVTQKADALLKRLQSEGRNSPADLLLTTDAGRLHRAKQADVLQPVRSTQLEAAGPKVTRDPDGFWFGLSVRARPIMYVRGRVDPTTLDSYEGLTSEQWRRRICIRSSNNIYNQSLVASMLAVHGAGKTEDWARGLVGNFARPPKGGDRDQIRAAAAGQCDIAIANTYYLGLMLNDKDNRQREAAASIAVFWPNQNDRGTHVNVSGIGLTRSARHRDNAIRLMEYLSSDAAQQWYGETNYEYPVRSGIPLSETLQAWGEFKADRLNLSTLGENNAEAVRIMDRAGWR